MRFAIVSDIHGNLPALNAVSEDAEKNNINCYIFVGDYCLSNPYPDEVISRIRNLDKKYIIRGNEEKYLENLIGKDQSTWTNGQMQISYYCYQKIKHDNLNYLLSMPEQRKLVISDTTLHMPLSSKVAKRCKDRRITQAAFSADIHTYLNENKQFNRLLDKLDNGVYIFGHTHIQWNYRSYDGKKLLINPGSCGLPLDCVDAGMPYTILDILNTDNIVVEERRVPFPLEEYISIFRQSEQFSKVNVWSRIILKEDTPRPFSISTWEKAYELWEVTKEKGEG